MLPGVNASATAGGVAIKMRASRAATPIQCPRARHLRQKQQERFPCGCCNFHSSALDLLRTLRRHAGKEQLLAAGAKFADPADTLGRDQPVGQSTRLLDVGVALCRAGLTAMMPYGLARRGRPPPGISSPSWICRRQTCHDRSTCTPPARRPWSTLHHPLPGGKVVCRPAQCPLPSRVFLHDVCVADSSPRDTTGLPLMPASRASAIGHAANAGRIFPSGLPARNRCTSHPAARCQIHWPQSGPRPRACQYDIDIAALAQLQRLQCPRRSLALPRRAFSRTQARAV